MATTTLKLPEDLKDRIAPLADLAPGLVPPGWGETVASAAERRRRAEGEDAARPIARWDGSGWAGLDA